MQIATNRPQDPQPLLLHPPPAAEGFSLQPNQRSKRTRLTLFWLCLLTLKTFKLDNLNVQYKTDSFDFHMNPTQNLILAFFFLHLVDGTNETGRFTAMQYIWLITLRQTIHVAMGTSRGKQARKKRSRVPSTFFFIEVTSNLHVEVSMPLGNTKEAIPLKKDSLNHIPTYFVILLDSKSILKPGPLDSSNPRSFSLNIPAHMNHSNSWLLEGISCPALSLSLCLTPLLKAGQERGPSFDSDPEGERGRRAWLSTGLWLWDCSKRETWRLGVCWEMPAHPGRDLVLYPSNCNMSSRPYSNGNITPNAKLCPKGASSFRI